VHPSEAIQLQSQEASPTVRPRSRHLRSHLQRPPHLPHVRHRSLRRTASDGGTPRRRHISVAAGHNRRCPAAAIDGQMGAGIPARRRRRRRRKGSSSSSSGLSGVGYGGGDV
ncbi:hypothetical protein LINGRAHAP2_LOCUS11756, partial [Linum grandiflorum]